MSFRTRLTTFFVLIVVIPMTAMGLLVFGLIDSSSRAKAEARASGIATTVASAYRAASLDASFQARAIARTLVNTPPARRPARLDELLAATGLARIEVLSGAGPAIDAGSGDAIAPGIAAVRAAAGRPQLTVTVAEHTASGFAHELAAGGGGGAAIVIRRGGTMLGSSLPGATGAASDSALPRHGRTTLGGADYEVITQRFSGFSGQIDVSVLSALSVTAGSADDDRMVAAGLIAGFLVLAFVFTLLASRSLQTQVSHFLEAARRLGGGDFSSPVPTVGNDEFAQLGSQFNSMSEQLRVRLGELEQERIRFRDSIRRIGEAFASGLDRDALLELALRTAIDAVEADRGRVSARLRAGDPLIEAEHHGSLAGLQTPLREAEHQALRDGVATAQGGGVHVAAVALRALSDDGQAHGVITVGREIRPFSHDDLELLRSLAARATLALDNVNLHIDVARQAVTDDLTGLATHGHFQELLANEMHESVRYDYPVSIAMFDIDNFKSVNDTHGHPQGDRVLRRVAEVLRDSCRDADVPVRYGGEELALVLPHTDLDGAQEIAERVRTAIERLAIPRVDHQGWLRVTVSAGVASGRDGDREALIAAADTALYAAKRSGKNRTVRAGAPVVGDHGARELARSTSGRDGE